MPSIANIVLADGMPTPVNHTFSPTDCTPSLATWNERASGIDIGMPTLTESLRKQGQVNRVVVKLTIPTLEVISGDAGGYTPAPQVAYSLNSNTEFLLPVRSTTQERENLRVMTVNAINNAFAVAAIEQLERTY